MSRYVRRRSAGIRGLIVVAAILALPAMGYAQEAVSGTVTDASGAVLPGVTVTATDQATGNTFMAVTDALGIYRIAVRPGVFRITAELPGFTIVNRPGVELLVGQEREVNLELSISAVEETVTVTGEAPLLDTTSSVVSGNIDPRQMEGSAAAGPELDGPGPAGAGQPVERGGRCPAEPAGVLPDQRGRPADGGR